VLQHGHELLAVAFRPDGKEIATASLEGHIHFWDPLEGSLQVPKPSSTRKMIFLKRHLQSRMHQHRRQRFDVDAGDN